jgi:RHS repeat-associated protein
VFNKFQNAAGIWTFAYTVDGHCKILTNTSTDPLSNTKKYTFNSVNQQVITDEIGRSTTYGFTSLQNPNLYWQQEVLFSGQIYPRGASLGYTHDVRGNITTSTATPIAVSGQSQLSPTNVTAVFPSACTNPVTCNKPTSTTDARGNETDYTYDPNTGLMLTKTLPAGSNGIRPQTRYTYQQYQATYYNASGVMTQGTPVWKLQQTSTCQTQASCANTADEVRVTYTYDGNLRPSTVTTMAGDSSLVSTVTYGYDAVGDVVSVTKPAGSSGGTATTVYFYDVARQQIGEVGPDPDGSGPLHNRATRTTYDLDGRVTKVETGWTNSQSAADFANFTSLQQHSTSYDSLGRKILETTSAGGTTLTATQYSYDVMDRLICTAVRLTPATFGSLPALACTATAAGSIGADGPDQITFNSYDAAGQLLTSISGYGTGAPRTDKTETYNADGQELTVADANGNLTTWVYDGLDRVSQILYPTKTNGAVSSTSDYEQFGYDAQNNVTSDRRRDGTTITTTFDGLNRQITQALPNLPTVYTSYDLLGRTTAVTYNAFTGVGSGKSYDALGRVTSETSYGFTMSYGYDLAGDLTRVTWWDGNSINYVFDLADEMTAVEENGATSGVGLLASYGYDDLGRVTAITRGNNVSTAYGYDGISRLTSLSHTMSGGNVQNQTYGLTYSSASQLRKVTASNSGYRWSGAATTLRAYGVNGQNQLTTSGGAQIAYDARGNLSSDSVTSYGYDVRNLLTSASGGASATLNNDPEGRLQSLTTGGAVTQFVYAGPNVAAEVNASGTILRRYAPGLAEDRPVVWYEGAGLTDRRWLLEDHQGSVVAVTNGAGGALAINSYDDYGAPGSGNLGRYQYTGQLWLPEVGLYDYKARDYSPTLGRFMQTDPVGYKDGLNWYDYVGDDPINRSDPTGNDWISDLWKNVKAGVEGVAARVAYVGIGSANARSDYKNTVKNLSPGDSAGRTAAKVAARNSTPAEVRAVVQGVRPSTGATPGSGGTANRTSAAADSLGADLGRAGKAAGVVGVGFAAYDIATATDKGHAVAANAGALAGGWAGGEAGAAVGAFGGPLAPITVPAGGLIGAVGGGIGGYIAGGDAYDAATGH